MGKIRHHAIIVTGSWIDPHLEIARVEAERIGLRPTHIIRSPWNGCGTVFIPPDGSKEFREESDEFDLFRAEFVGWLREYEEACAEYTFEWAEIQYGDDDGNNLILSDSEEGIR